MNRELLVRLRELRIQVRNQLEGLAADQARQQFHPDLSPMAWHVGHSFFTEAYWLQEKVLGDNTHTARWHPLYFPEYSQKAGRGQQLQTPEALLEWNNALETALEEDWITVGNHNHPLLDEDYLAWFLIQHYAQHLETMAMVRQQAHLSFSPAPVEPELVEAADPATAYMQLAGGETRIGGSKPASYDNELGTHIQIIQSFRLAQNTVTNGQWLAFMQSGGYRDLSLWDRAGREWLQKSSCEHPQHWRPHPDGGWYSPDPEETLGTKKPVHGICWHEAQAYARWTDTRLPHEYEWEYAASSGAIDNVGRVWEWCDNALHPYSGFQAFPYDGYSTPWFDGHHRVARGASCHTQPEIRRSSFRNFYPEGHRHVFAGLRLAKN